MSGRSKPATMRSSVVLPQPEGPSSEKNSPRSTASDTPSTARTAPKLFDTPSNTRKPVTPIDPQAL